MKQTTSIGRRAEHGFTLIELMTVVVVVAILASIALPAYAAYVQRSRVPPALFALSSFQVRMEMQFQDTGSYGATACTLTPPSAENFNVSCVPNADGLGQAYVATATGFGPMTGYKYRIDQSGIRSTINHPKGVPSGNCWTMKGRICES
jgi:prepilin-type N-terminal cleavage/methylation domain-containing protein